MESHLGTKRHIQSIGKYKSIAKSLEHQEDYSAPQVPHEISATPRTPQDPALECLAPSPSKGVAVKKTKVSTPVSDKPGSEIFHCPDISPLQHKLLPVRISSGLHEQQNFAAETNFNIKQPKCVILDCSFAVNLRPLARKKLRGKGKAFDWESTKLIITYYRLSNLDSPHDSFICLKHWREWYH